MKRDGMVLYVQIGYAAAGRDIPQAQAQAQAQGRCRYKAPSGRSANNAPGMQRRARVEDGQQVTDETLTM